MSDLKTRTARGPASTLPVSLLLPFPQIQTIAPWGCVGQDSNPVGLRQDWNPVPRGRAREKRARRFALSEQIVHTSVSQGTALQNAEVLPLTGRLSPVDDR